MGMHNKMRKVFRHFGRENQLKKLGEEYKELGEAIQSGDFIHVAEELADVFVIMCQLELDRSNDVESSKDWMLLQCKLYGIDALAIYKITNNKLNRTLERIDTIPGYGVV